MSPTAGSFAPVSGTRAPTSTHLLVTPSGEIHLKSRRTARWFRRTLLENLEAALRRSAPGAAAREIDHRIVIEHDDLVAAAEAAAATIGIQRVAIAEPVAADDLDTLVAAVADASRERVRGRTFAVRVRRRGTHPWGSPDAARAIGSALLAGAAGVDLDTPEVEVEVDVHDERAVILGRAWEGVGGVPLGTQPEILALLSGGFDSPVAAWMLMRRGAPVDFVHFKLDCAQSDHALAVAHGLWRQWGAGTDPRVWVVDFQAVKEALATQCPPRLRQIVLKQLMFQAADRVAELHGHPALVTGESVGQVSSQTLHHLAAIDSVVGRSVLRPLAGFTKNEIITRAREIGTEALSSRAKEVCDLTDGPVAIAAQRDTLDRAHDGLPEGLVEEALATREVVTLSQWMPGFPLVRVVSEVPEGAAEVSDVEPTYPSGTPLAVRGPRAAHVAARMLARGREVVVLEPC